jgi:hypothetical protein
MNGVKLRTLDAPDLLDVLHYMYETDLFEATMELQEAKDKARTVIYEEMYESYYPYGTSSVSSDNYGLPLDDEFSDDPLPKPLDPKAMTSRPKAYTPATKFNPDAVNPYGGLLDAPLGH